MTLGFEFSSLWPEVVVNTTMDPLRPLMKAECQSLVLTELWPMRSLIHSFIIHFLSTRVGVREQRYTARENSPHPNKWSSTLIDHPLCPTAPSNFSLAFFPIQPTDASLPLPGPSMFIGYFGFIGPILGPLLPQTIFPPTHLQDFWLQSGEKAQCKGREGETTTNSWSSLSQVLNTQ